MSLVVRHTTADGTESTAAYDSNSDGHIISLPPGGSADFDAGRWFGPAGGIQVGVSTDCTRASD